MIFAFDVHQPEPLIELRRRFSFQEASETLGASFRLDNRVDRKISIIWLQSSVIFLILQTLYEGF
jgi:hypothetical protein